MTDEDAQAKLDKIRALVVGVGRTDNPENGMDMLANAVLRILDRPT